MRSDRQIQELSRITVSFDHVQLDGRVAGCHPAERGWIVSVTLASGKQRLEERFPAGEKSLIGVIEHGGTVIHHGAVVDTSPSGLGLRLDKPIETGARVYVETQSMMVFGEVRHCRRLEVGYYVAGVMIVEVVPDVRSQSMFSLMLNSLRWKLNSPSIRARDLRAYLPEITRP